MAAIEWTAKKFFSEKLKPELPEGNSQVKIELVNI